MNLPPHEQDIVLTPEQVAEAPEPVRQWLYRLHQSDDRLEHGFILERYGRMSSGDGLAICTSLEVKNLLHLLSDDLLACEILFALGCDYRNGQTGERRGHVTRLRDFLDHTDARNLDEVERALEAINRALQRLRHDPDTILSRADGHGGVRVHELTQHVIYAVWRRLMRLTERHHRRAAVEVKTGDLFQNVTG